MNLYSHRNFSMTKLVTSGAFSDLYDFVPVSVGSSSVLWLWSMPPSSILRSTIVVANNGMLSDG